MADKEDSYNEIAKEIHSDSSPVGIDAKKTHILIIQMLRDLESRIKKIEQKLRTMDRNIKNIDNK